MGLVAGTKFWSLRLDFAAKMTSSHDATSPYDLLQGIVAGTGPIVCADLYIQLQHGAADLCFSNCVGILNNVFHLAQVNRSLVCF